MNGGLSGTLPRSHRVRVARPTVRPEGHSFGRTHPRLVLCGLGLLLLSAMLAGVHAGAFPIAAQDVPRLLLEPLRHGAGEGLDRVQMEVFWAIRLPRVLLGVLIGAGLAVTGVAIQGMFRNPLAEPGLIGVSGGAALAAAAYIVIRGSGLGGSLDILGAWGLPLAAVGGAVATILAVYRLGTCAGRTSVATLLLAGIAINALAGAGMGLIIFISDESQLRTITFWTMGSLAGASWGSVAILSALIVPACVALIALARALNAMLLGEAEAGHLGIPVQTVKRLLILLVGLVVGTAVAFTGIIGFIGLVVPHLARLLLGPDHRKVFPASALLGGALLLGADAFARIVAPPLELPIGAITALAGAPFFLALLLRSRRRWLG